LTNGKYYQTLNEDKTMSNIGPGMYDLSPYPSYMGQQLINPTITDYRYRQHRENDERSQNTNSSTHFSERSKRLSMNDIFGKTSQTQSQAQQRPHTSSSSLIQHPSSRSPGPAATTGAPVASSGRLTIKEKQVLSERKSDVQSVLNLPEYPQKYFPRK
jgi:hypothetical protein